MQDIKGPQEDHNPHDAFISYSRKDVAFARKLEQSLENYKPPKDLAVPQRALRIFRDEGDLTGVEYFQSIETHLQASAKMIVVCSPDARDSDYVNDEIRRFAKLRGPERIVPLLLRGVPNNEATPAQSSEMAFPDALIESMQMPLASSFLGFDPRKDRFTRGVFDGSWYTLLANLYEVSRSEIEQRDRKKQLRQRRITVAILTSIILALSTLSAIALWQRHQAVEQRQAAQARALAAEAELAWAEAPNLVERSALLAVAAARREPTLQATRALRRALALLPRPVAKLSKGTVKDPSAAAISPDGRTIALGGTDGLVRLYTGPKWAERDRLAHESDVIQVSFAPDGKTLRTFTTERVARVWSLDESAVLARFDFSEGCRPLGFSDDNRRAACGLGFVDLQSGEEIRRIRSSRTVMKTAFSPDGKFFVGGGWDVAQLWDATSGELLAKLPHPLIRTNAVMIAAVAFSADGRTVASGGSDNSVRLWGVPDGKALADLPHEDDVRAVVFSANGRYLASETHDHVIRVWDVEQRRVLMRLYLDVYLSELTFSGDSQRLLLIGEDRTVRIFQADSGRELTRLVLPDGPDTVALSADGTILVAPGAAGAARVFETGDGARVANASFPYGGTQVVFTNSGQLIAAASPYKFAYIWEVDEGKQRYRFEHQGRVESVAFAPDGQSLAVGSIDNLAQIWSAEDGSPSARLEHEGGVWSLDFSPNGEYLATAGRAERNFTGQPVGENNARVWRLRDRQEVLRLSHDGPIHEVVFGPKGRWLATASSDQTAVVWDAASGEVVARLKHDAAVFSVAFSPDARYVATGCDNGDAHLWKIGDSTPSAHLLHEASVTQVTFSPKGDYLATASGGVALIWSLATGQIISRIDSHEKVRSVAFSPDGRYLATGTESGFAVWLWKTDDLIAETCRRLSRTLTANERVRYLAAVTDEAICSE